MAELAEADTLKNAPVQAGADLYCDLVSPGVLAILRQIETGGSVPSGRSRAAMTGSQVAAPAPYTGMEEHMRSPDIQPAQSVREVQSDDGAVLLDIGQGMCYSLNPVGSRIWELLKQNYSATRIAETIAAEYGADPGQVLKDVLAYTEELRRNKLLVAASVAEGPGPKPGLTSVFRRFVSSIKNRHANERKS